MSARKPRGKKPRAKQRAATPATGKLRRAQHRGVVQAIDALRPNLEIAGRQLASGTDAIVSLLASWHVHGATLYSSTFSAVTQLASNIREAKLHVDAMTIAIARAKDGSEASDG
ncbi:hypothetical protein Rctr16k_08 [Virus Rctr16k]|nr:hypothetical protein Rctr16k_08 [Virus Rctr16k]